MKSTNGGERIRLVLIDDHLLLRESLARLLAAERDFKIVAQCASAPDALKNEADAVVGDVAHHGVAEAIERFVLARTGP